MSRLLLVLAAAPVLPPKTTSPEPDRQLVRAIYEELVNINTGCDTGKTTPAAETVAKRLLDAAFARADVVVDGAAPHKANLVARYRGTGAARRLLLLAHLDVVEPSAKTRASTPSPSSRRTATSTDAAPETTRPRPPSGWRTFVRYKREGLRPIGR